MAGAYCHYCNHRCFVLRRVPDDARSWGAGQTIHMATCKRGRQHDMSSTGYDFEGAINPVDSELLN